MRILIVYASKSGTTEICAKQLAALTGAALHNLAESASDLSQYDCVVVGGPIRAGRIHPAVRRYLKDNAAMLRKKQYALFTCNLSGDDAAMFRANFGDLLDGALACASFGGLLDPTIPRDIFDKIVLRIVGGLVNSGKLPPAAIREDAIAAFAQKLA